jgi:hypothetical protein
MVPGARIELATPAFSGRRSTNELPRQSMHLVYGPLFHLVNSPAKLEKLIRARSAGKFEALGPVMEVSRTKNRLFPGCRRNTKVVDWLLLVR